MIDNFRDQYFFLSNMYPCMVRYDHIFYPSSENAYQSAKCPGHEYYFAEIYNPFEAKKMGRKLQMVSGWDKIKVQVMTDIVTDKFKRNPFLMRELLRTGNEILVEGNTWGDTFWGVCNGKGENHLGKILMKIRKAHTT